MNFTWLSNAPWAPTGYGNQTRLFVPRFLKLGHNPAIIAFYGHDGTPINLNGITIYGGGYSPYGQDVLSAHTINHKAKLCLSLLDAWVLDQKLVKGGIKWVPWFPIDSEPLPRAVYEVVKNTWDRIVFSEFGRKMMNNAGLDCLYIPHGVDTKIYYPVKKEDARERTKLPQDKFIFGMVAANKGNPSRKSFHQHLEAFAMLKKRASDVQLYIHSTTAEHGEMDGVNLVEYAQFLGLSTKTLADNDLGSADIIFTDQYGYLLGYPEPFMRDIFSAIDCHVLASMGEGFGIPTLEAQACGTPVIVSGWTASEELCFSGITLDKKKASKWWTPLGAYQYVVDPNELYKAMFAMYKRPRSGEKAREGALQYDADLIIDKYWKPILTMLEDRLEAEGQTELKKTIEVPAPMSSKNPSMNLVTRAPKLGAPMLTEVKKDETDKG